MRNHHHKKLIATWMNRLNKDYQSSTQSGAFLRIIPSIRHRLLITYENRQALIHPPRILLSQGLSHCLSLLRPL